jgi:hypothetical protein
MAPQMKERQRNSSMSQPAKSVKLIGVRAIIRYSYARQGLQSDKYIARVDKRRFGDWADL